MIVFRGECSVLDYEQSAVDDIIAIFEREGQNLMLRVANNIYLYRAGCTHRSTHIDLLSSFFCVSGLRWHPSGLSELPLKQRLLLLPFFSSFCCFCGRFSLYHAHMYEHVVEHLLRGATVIRTHHGHKTHIYPYF